MWKKCFASLAMFLMAHSVFAQSFQSWDGVNVPKSDTILPKTAYCQLGTDLRPAPYCTDSAPCKTIDGKRVCLANAALEPGAFRSTATCWAMSRDYTCLQYEDSCLTLASKSNCKFVSEACNKDEDGNEMISTSSRIPGGCLSKTKTYKCTYDTGITETKTVSCDTTGAMNGLDWSSSSPSAEGDFMSAVMAQEFVRQIADGERDGAFNGLFEGIPYACREGWAGLRSCCDVGGVAASNGDFAQKAGMTVAFAGVKAGASYAASVGSSYVYDFIGGSASGAANASSAMGAGGAGFGAFGFGTSASSAAGMFATNASSIQLSQNLYFNPYAFAIAVGVMVVMELMSCEDEEAKLSQYRGTGLCTRVGTYCSKKILGACVEHKTSYCCYNGKLARGIQTSAKVQLGLDWGSPQSPMCGGGQSPNKHALTLEQLSSLDFSHPSMAAALEPFRQQIIDTFNKKTKPYLDSGGFAADTQAQSSERTKALCLQRQKTSPSTVCE